MPVGHVFIQPEWTPNLNWVTEHLAVCTGWVEPWANSNIVAVGELRSIRDKEISVPNRACVCYFLTVTSYGTVTALTSICIQLYMSSRHIYCFVTSIHSASLNNACNVFEIRGSYRNAVALVNKICIEGLFSYISESRFPTINHSNDIASTNKVSKWLFTSKYANISMVINDKSNVCLCYCSC